MHLIKFFAFGLIAMCLGCSKPQQDVSTIKIAGHAVTGLNNLVQIYPENSQSAISYAFSFDDLDGIEIDVQRSADGSWWLFHDEQLDPRTNLDGMLHNLSDNVLMNGRYKGLNGDYLVRLMDVDFSTLKKKIVFIEPKFLYVLMDFDIQEIIDLNNYLEEKWAEHITVKWILNFSEFANDLTAQGLSIYRDLTKVSDAQSFLTDNNYTGFFVKNSEFTKPEVHEIQEIGGEVIIFDVKSPSGVRSALEKRPDMILPADFKVALVEKFK